MRRFLSKTRKFENLKLIIIWSLSVLKYFKNQNLNKFTGYWCKNEGESMVDESIALYILCTNIIIARVSYNTYTYIYARYGVGFYKENNVCHRSLLCRSCCCCCCCWRRKTAVESFRFSAYVGSCIITSHRVYIRI